jgi:hypothetical protein
VRAKLVEVQQELVNELETVEAELLRLSTRRSAIVAELRRCRDAFGYADMHHRRFPLAGDIDAVPENTREIAGSELRGAVAEMVRIASRPVTVEEIYRMLLAHGLRPAGYHAEKISNALRAEVKAGRVLRLARGMYEATMGDGPPDHPSLAE